ncbi:hypothetical protein B0H14DRAFT_2711479, partial [Mycena olivaceomarginata]
SWDFPALLRLMTIILSGIMSLLLCPDLADHPTLYCCGRETANQYLSAMLIFHVYIVLRRLRYDQEV